MQRKRYLTNANPVQKKTKTKRKTKRQSARKRGEVYAHMHDEEKT
jgi:hypothetical protein